MIPVQRLYPQYMTVTDRRKESVPVSFERRSGVERRSQDRVTLDTNLTRDIFEVKNKISQLQKVNPVSFTENISKAASNNLKTDEFIKATKVDTTEAMKSQKEPPSSSSILAGVLAVGMVGALAGAFFGPAAGVFALGFGAYFGGKVLKQAIVSQIVEDEKTGTRKK